MTHPVSQLPASLSDLLRELRATTAEIDQQPRPEQTVNPGYTAGYHEGWRLAMQLAEEQHQRAAPDWATPLRQLAADLAEHIRRVRAAQNAIPATTRGGTIDALEDVRGRALTALERAKAAEQDRIRAAAADTAAHPVIGSAAVPPPDDLTDWSAYPKLPFPDDMPLTDMGHLAMFLGGDDNSFTGDLLRLIAKADPRNLNRLAGAYPRHVRAWIMWRACAPVPARTLVALLEATSTFERNSR